MAKEIEQSYRISALKTGGTDIDESKRSNKKKDGVGSTGLELQYHSKAEY